MKISIAPAGGIADVRYCDECKTNTFHDAVQRMVFSPSGARTLWLWECEKHPLPEIVNDEVDPQRVLHNEGDTSALIANPTINDMIITLSRMGADHGMDAHVEIKPISNMLGSFVIRIVEVEA